jgi:predicted outer membrane repeat protein
MRHSRSFHALAVAGALSLVGCGAAETDVRVSTQALVTNCTGAAISEAVSAGGDVAVDCGANPVTITLPSTNVAHNAVLRAVRPGTVTITHASTLFEVASGVSLSLVDLAFFGAASMQPAVHTVGGQVTLTRDSFSNYPAFVISVHNGSKLGVTECKFANNGVGQSSLSFGGSIYNEGSVTSVQNSTFINNHSTGSGGAITSFGSLSVVGSTFVNNGAANGGAIYANSFANTVQITNSTFVNNTASNMAGAIYFAGFQSQATIDSSTFSNNMSPQGTFFGNIAAFDTILVDPVAPSTPCKLSGTNNLQWPAGPPSCGPGFVRGNPNLGPLANNGGPTETMAILMPSAAFRAVTGACPVTDQRGIVRAHDRDGDGSGLCDIGAYEF